MSEKNGEIVQEIKARWSEGRCVDVSFETVKLAAVDIQVLCRIIHDHEALIGVLVGGAERISKCPLGHHDSVRIAKETLSHPLVQEYLKKEKL